MSNAISIPKIEYLKLNQQAKAYRELAGRLFEFLIKDPVQDVVSDFKNSDIYTDDFLTDLESGLRKSSYSEKTIKPDLISKNYEAETVAARHC